jgi:cell division protein FtsL
VIALLVVACALCALGLLRVEREHEVLQLGYKLSHEAEHVTELRETRRRLELELATLTAPERIRRLATQLGMVPVAPDRIRIIDHSAQRSALLRAPAKPELADDHSAQRSALLRAPAKPELAAPRHEVASQP